MSDKKRTGLEVASWIGGIAGAVIALVALIVDIHSKSGETVAPTEKADASRNTAPEAPTDVDATSQPGRRIVVTFQVAVAGTGAVATKYIASAASEVRPGSSILTGWTTDNKVAPILLSGCTAGVTYTVTIVAKAGNVSSRPVELARPVMCVE